jgi:hypothetical protein
LKEERQRAKEEEEKDLKLKSIRGSKVVDEEADSKVSSPGMCKSNLWAMLITLKQISV